jgi:hypothetical protein
MSLSCRVTPSFVALFACPILWAISLSAPGVGQARAATAADHGQPHAPTTRGPHHVRGAYIVCPTPDVHSCHRAFAHKHRAQTH